MTDLINFKLSDSQINTLLKTNLEFFEPHFLKNMEGGIAYVGLSSLSQVDGRAVIIDGVVPNMENFKNGFYPFIAKYYLAYNKDTSDRDSIRVSMRTPDLAMP